MVKHSILVLCCSLASAHLLSAATYYANSSTGSDSNNGSSVTPWKTLYNSVPKLSPGDTLLCTGTFSEAPGYGSTRTVGGSGSAGHPITIKGNGTAVINLQDNSGDDATYSFTGSYIVIDGFGFTSTLSNGVAYGGFFSFSGSNCVAQNLVVTNCFGSHEAAAGNADHLWCFQSRGNYNTFTNIVIHEVDDADFFRIHGAYNLISHITVSNCLNLYYDWNGNATLHADIVQIGLYQGDSDTRSNVLENSMFINHDSDATKLSPSGGIYKSCYSGVQTAQPIWWSHWAIRNNIFINWGQGFQMENYTNHFYNNIFFNTCVNYQSPPASLYFGSGGCGDGVGSVVLNNIWISSGGMHVEPSPVTASYNAWDSTTYSRMNGGGWSPGASNLTVTLAQVGFVNATSYPYDLHLTSSSVLRGKGKNLTSDPSACTTDADGNARPSSGAWDIGPYQYGTVGQSTNPVIGISPSSLDFGPVASGATVANTLIIQNVGGGILSGTAIVPAPFGIVSGGTYSLGNNQTQTVWVSYSPSGSIDSQVVTFTGGGGATAAVTGSLLGGQSGLSFRSFAGSITAPFATNNGGYISQGTQTGVADGGQAVYGFNITNAGNYTVSVSVNAPDTSANSLYINIDAQPTDPAMIWDIPVTTGFTNQTVSWRGDGTFTAPQYVPEVFFLSAGTHQLIIVGREAGVQLGEITVAPYLASRPTPPSPPPNLRVTAPNP